MAEFHDQVRTVDPDGSKEKRDLKEAKMKVPTIIVACLFWLHTVTAGKGTETLWLRSVVVDTGCFKKSSTTLQIPLVVSAMPSENTHSQYADLIGNEMFFHMHKPMFYK